VITGLAELWGRLPEPEAQDLVRSLRFARLLEADPESPAAVLSLAWGLVEAEHAAAGWEVQPSAHSPRCEAAARAARQAWPGLVEPVRLEVARAPGEVLVLGLAAASRALFGAWDLVPADDLELVLLGAPNHTSGSGAGGTLRVRPAGRLAPLYAAHSTAVDLAGSPIRVPTALLLAALVSDRARSADSVDALVFAAAATRAAETHQWDTVERIAERLGAGDAPRLAAARLGLEDTLGLERKGVARWTQAVKRLLTR
jgi:hypothetical protein